MSIIIKGPNDLERIVARSKAPESETGFMTKAACIWRKKGRKPSPQLLAKAKKFAMQRSN